MRRRAPSVMTQSGIQARCSVWMQVVLGILLSFKSANGSTFSVVFQSMPEDSMVAISDGKNDGIYFSCKDACRQLKHEDGNKLPPTLPWCERGAPYLIQAGRAELGRIRAFNRTDIPPVYSIKSAGECERSIQIHFHLNSEDPDATRGMDSVGYWDGATVYSDPDAPFHFVAIPRPHYGPCLIKFSSVEVFIEGKPFPYEFYQECPLTRPFWGRTEGYLKGFGVITRVRFTMFLDSVNRRVRFPLYALALGAFTCAAVALFQPTCPVLVALAIFDAMIAVCEFWLILAVQKVDDLVQSRFQAHLMGSVLSLVGFVLQVAFTILLSKSCGLHVFNLNIVQALADFVVLGHNVWTSYIIEKKWAE